MFAFADIWHTLFCPLLRVLLGLAGGLLIANLLEALRWTRHLSRFCLPFARAAHLGEAAGAAFALAFVSPAAANSLLSEKYAAGKLSLRELVLANLFNSLPAFFVHTPSLFLLIWPVLGWPAATYVALTLVAALLRTGAAFFFSRLLLAGGTACAETEKNGELREKRSICAIFQDAWRRFLLRMPRIVCFTVPVYVLMFLLQRNGLFDAAEAWLAEHAVWLSFLKPQAMSIIALHLAAELGAAVAAAGGVLQTGGLDGSEIVLALMVGNILSTPMRALRHQLPAYSGYFRPMLGLRLIVVNQGLRAASMTLVTVAYYLCMID